MFLLDFGGVQDAIRLSAGASSTMIGTPVHAPLEQFVGRASVRSDLYAVAATLLFLLDAHESRSTFPLAAWKIDFRSVVEISSAGLALVLSSWLEPDQARRTLPVAEAAALLRGEEVPGTQEADARCRASSACPMGRGFRLDDRGGTFSGGDP